MICQVWVCLAWALMAASWQSSPGEDLFLDLTRTAKVRDRRKWGRRKKLLILQSRNIWLAAQSSVRFVWVVSCSLAEWPWWRSVFRSDCSSAEREIQDCHVSVAEEKVSFLQKVGWEELLFGNSVVTWRMRCCWKEELVEIRYFEEDSRKRWGDLWR